jgi:hypothetical protein
MKNATELKTGADRDARVVAAEQAKVEQTAQSYRAPQVFVAGSTIELVQGTYGPYRDISGYYTYG